MDPQQRLFLEESWKALEDAGYAGSDTQGRRVGVYVGCQESGYARLFGAEAPRDATLRQIAQNTGGSLYKRQLPCASLTIYALVRPANIILMLPIATHKANL